MVVITGRKDWAAPELVTGGRNQEGWPSGQRHLLAKQTSSKKGRTGSIPVPSAKYKERCQRGPLAHVGNVMVAQAAPEFESQSLRQKSCCRNYSLDRGRHWRPQRTVNPPSFGISSGSNPERSTKLNRVILVGVTKTWVTDSILVQLSTTARSTLFNLISGV